MMSLYIPLILLHFMIKVHLLTGMDLTHDFMFYLLKLVLFPVSIVGPGI
jgi:hypothetical protein